MAHHMKVRKVPHKNKDGSESQSRSDYIVVDRHRGKKRRVGVASSLRAAKQIITDEWNRINEERNNV